MAVVLLLSNPNETQVDVPKKNLGRVAEISQLGLAYVSTLMGRKIIMKTYTTCSNLVRTYIISVYGIWNC